MGAIMKIRFRVQRHIALFFRADDSGEWVATCCRRGLEQLLGRRLKTGEEFVEELYVGRPVREGAHAGTPTVEP